MIHCLDFARENDNKINPLPDTPPITELPFHQMILNVFSKHACMKCPLGLL